MPEKKIITIKLPEGTDVKLEFVIPPEAGPGGEITKNDFSNVPVESDDLGFRWNGCGCSGS